MSVKSITQLHKRTKTIILISIFVMLGLIVFTSLQVFRDYRDQSFLLKRSYIEDQINGYLRDYQYQALALAAQPVFNEVVSSNMAMIDNYEKTNSQIFILKRQLSRIINNDGDRNDLFKGASIINFEGKNIINVGDTNLKYFVSINACYRDTSLNMNPGSPCNGKIRLYFTYNGLVKYLSTKKIKVSKTASKYSFPIKKLVTHTSLNFSSINFPNDIFVDFKEPNYTSIILLTLLSILIMIISFIGYGILRKTYSKYYLNPLNEIHNALRDGNKKIETNLGQSDEIRDLISIVNTSIVENKKDTISQLVHDLQRPLNQLQEIAISSEGKIKQALVNIYSHLAMSMDKAHYDNEDIHSIDLRCLLFDSIEKDFIINVENNELRFFAPKSCFSKCSYQIMVRIINNIIYNAFKANEENPKISVEIHLKSDGLFNVIDIIDNGIGIPAENRGTIFLDGVSYTNSTGKGLAFCKRKIAEFGGSIQCMDKNNGAHFQIKIPCSSTPISHIDRIFIKSSSKLVIIDDENPYYIKNSALSSYDYLHLKNEKQIKDFFRNNESSMKSDFIYLIDYHISEEINGLDIIRKYSLEGISYIVSIAGILLRESRLKSSEKIPVIPKDFFKHISVCIVDSFEMVFMDDDQDLVHEVLEINDSVNILPVYNFLQLNLVSNLINNNIPIILDNRVDGSNQKGLDFAEYLTSKDFMYVAIQSGDYNDLKKKDTEIKIIPKGKIYNFIEGRYS